MWSCPLYGEQISRRQIMSPNTLSLVVLCAVLVGVLLFAAFSYGRDFTDNLRRPMRKTKAQVIGRRVQEEQGTGWSPATLYFVTFADENGGRRELAVPEEDFQRLEEGQSVLLRTKGAWYRGFQM